MCAGLPGQKGPRRMPFTASRGCVSRTLGIKYKRPSSNISFISESLSSFSLFVLAYTIYIYTTNRRHSHFHNEQNKKRLVRILFGIVCILRSLALCKYVLHVNLSLAVWTVFCKCVFFSRRDTWVCKCDRKKSK